MRVAYALAALAGGLLPSRRARAALAGRGLRGDQLFDLLCVAMFGGIVVALWSVRAGAIYFWMKDLTQEFLKLSLLYTTLELTDRICCSFGTDALEALAASCTQFMGAGATWSGRAGARAGGRAVGWAGGWVAGGPEGRRGSAEAAMGPSGFAARGARRSAPPCVRVRAALPLPLLLPLPAAQPSTWRRTWRSRAACCWCTALR